jgi:hypothetical protein
VIFQYLIQLHRREVACLVPSGLLHLSGWNYYQPRPLYNCARIFQLDQEPSRKRVVVPVRQATQPGGIGSLESILGLLKSLKIRALVDAKLIV